MWHYIRMLLRVIPMAIYWYFQWVLRYSRHPEKYPVELRYKKFRKFCSLVCNHFPLDVHVEGLENLPKDRPCFIVCNHQSAIDPLILVHAFDTPTTFVAKKEAKKIPVVGRCLTAVDGLYMDREDLKQSLRVMMKVQDDLLKKQDKNWVVFAEGTRLKDVCQNVASFHHGTFRPGMKAQVPIVPVVLCGSYHVLKLKPAFKRYPVTVKVLKPIYPEEYKDKFTSDIAEQTHDMINNSLAYEVRLKHHQDMVNLKSKKYNPNEFI